VDAVAVVSAPAEVQRQRVLARASMDETKLAAILARQARFAHALAAAASTPMSLREDVPWFR